MIEYLLYRLAGFIVLVVPLRVAYWIAGGIAGLSFYFWRGPKEILKENLRNVFRDWSEERISECARANFVQFGKFIADFFYIGKLNSGNIGEFVKVENREYVDRVVARKKGVLAVGAHIGNWDLGAVTMALLGYPLSAVVLGHQEAKVDAIFVGQRVRKGVKVIPVGKAGRESYRTLLRGGMVAILGDRDVTSRGTKVPFFGKPALIPRGMPVLAVRTGASILPCMMLRQRNGRFKFFFEKPFRADLSRNADESERDVLERWIKILEKYIVLYPEQWFMYHRMWES